MTVRRYLELSSAWPPNSDDVAHIHLRLGDQVLSRIADTDKQSVRDYFRASATSLALWFVDNWWRLRWETLNDSRYASIDWRLRHELNSAAGGSMWPPVMIYSTANRIAFAPSLGSNKTTSGPQQYFEFKMAMIMAGEYENELDGFLNVVVEHCARTVDGKALATILQQIRTERLDLELSGWRRLEACLGYDPDEAPNAVVSALINLEDVAGEDGVEEAARAQPGNESARTLNEAIEATRAGVEVDLGLASQIALDPELPRTASPWQFAESAASALRRIIGVQRGPLRHREFSEMLGVRWADLKAATATARKLPYGARLANSGVGAHLSLKTLSSHDRRFELARALGDSVWQPHSAFGIVSRSKTDRQKFQRAFAHSLLCPFDDLSRVLDVNNPTQEAIESAARRFLVHSTVVRNQLVYKGYLPYENANEEVEAA